MSYVQGFAFAAEEVFEEHKAAFVEAKKIVGDAKVVLERAYGYNRMDYLPDWAVIKDLTLLQQMTLVYGGPLPFGGSKEGSWLVIYTD